MKNNKKFFSRNIINTARNEEFTRIQKREPVILAGYFFQAFIYDIDFDMYHIILPNSIYYYSLKNKCECFGLFPPRWMYSVLEERDGFETSQKKRRIWKKQMYCGKDIRLKQVLKYLYSGISLAVLLLFIDKKYRISLPKRRFIKEDLILLQKWLLDVFDIESRVDLNKTKLIISKEHLLKMIDTALKDIEEFSNLYMKKRLSYMRKEIADGKSQKDDRNKCEFSKQ